VERSAGQSGPSLGVPARRDVERLRVRLDDGMKQRIESFDPLQIGPGEFGGAQAAGGDERVELGDRRLEPRGVRIGVLARDQSSVDARIVATWPGNRTTRVD
jgi:hypothetical protein